MNTQLDWLEYSETELARTRREIEDEMEQRITRITEQRQVKCDMCDGLGFSQIEEVCTNCAGVGRVNAWVFDDCGHLVESEDCREFDCLCEVMVDLGERCQRKAAHTVSEPFTPAGFEVRCCVEHAADFISQGYGRAA